MDYYFIYLKISLHFLRGNETNFKATRDTLIYKTSSTRYDKIRSKSWTDDLLNDRPPKETHDGYQGTINAVSLMLDSTRNEGTRGMKRDVDSEGKGK